MNNPTYEQRVQTIANKMRQRLIETEDASRLPDDAFIPVLAVEAVKHMAELAKRWMNAYAWTTEHLNDYLINEGLIPDTDQQQLSILKPGEPGSGGYDPNNPPPDQEAEQS